jgi:CRISPR/Cas system-associated exonuclease Cas4 (RecB family)
MPRSSRGADLAATFRPSGAYAEGVPSVAALTLAPWSVSKIQCALRCPLEFHFRYVDRLHEPDVAPETRLGKAVHGALEAVLLRTPVPDALATARRDLPDEERARFDELGANVAVFAARIETFRGRRRVRSELIEHRLAITFDFAPTEFVAKNAFFRGVWDAGYLFDDGVLAVVDHKTGVRRPGADYADQLGGYATLAAAHLAFVRKVWLGLHFVADAAMEWTPPLDVAEVRARVAPRLAAYIEEAAQAARRREPRVSTWCTRCSYRSICPAMRAAALAAELPEPPPELVDDKQED